MPKGNSLEGCRIGRIVTALGLESLPRRILASLWRALMPCGEHRAILGRRTAPTAVPGPAQAPALASIQRWR